MEYNLVAVHIVGLSVIVICLQGENWLYKQTVE